tara:strand:+ start:6463 stop:6612 length:150 start_codon:yes stop_codon:yes gene_type:complete
MVGLYAKQTGTIKIKSIHRQIDGGVERGGNRFGGTFLSKIFGARHGNPS